MPESYIDILPLQQWLPAEGPLIAAGPCSAESREQVLETARFLASTGKVQVFRSGVWKPRTRPGSFEGIGEEALSWLTEAKKETSLKITVEVANAKHVELAIKAGVDILWIGARTTVNPFYVQEIADAVKGHDIAVWIKNPLHPDPELWAGAIERIRRAGIERIAAVHRGWFTPVARPFRNEPRWEQVVALKLKMPDLPVLCDPSHISGRRDMVPLVAQHALDLNFDGLMVEVHPDPPKALSDADQQLSFGEFNDMVQNLVLREEAIPDQDFNTHLKLLRQMIDGCDMKMLDVLNERMGIVKEIGRYKRENNVSILQLERWREIVETRMKAAESKGLDKEFVHELLQVIHKTSLNMQTGE